MTPKGKAEIICVDGLGVPLFIDHVTPWGRTNWWPHRAPCFVPIVHKGIRVRSCRGWGRREAAVGTSRFPIEYLVRMNLRGALPLGRRGIRHTHSLIHSRIHAIPHIHTLSGGILVPVVGLLLYKWSKADPYSQPCVRLPFIPQPSWIVELWVFSGAPCLLGWDCTGARCGTTLFTPTQGQWSFWLGWERETEEREMGRREKERREEIERHRLRLTEWMIERGRDGMRGTDGEIQGKESVQSKRHWEIALLVTEVEEIRSWDDGSEREGEDRP